MAKSNNTIKLEGLHKFKCCTKGEYEFDMNLTFITVLLTLFLRKLMVEDLQEFYKVEYQYSLLCSIL